MPIITISKGFFLACTAFLAGIVAGTLGTIEMIYVYAVVLFALVTVILLRKNSLLVTIALCIAFSVSGCAWMNYARSTIEGRRTALQGKEIEFQGVIADEPQEREDNKRVTVRITNIDKVVLAKKDQVKITATVPTYEALAYADIVKGKCILEVPEEKNEPFSYSGYLASRGIAFTCQKGVIVRVAEGNGGIQEVLLSLKNTLAARIGAHMPRAQASLLSGILMGKRDATPQAVSDAFSKTGLTHIVAVSGYNISIVIAVVAALIFRIGIHKKYTILLISIFVIIFVVFTGGSSAAVRAGIMGIAGLLALQVGRLPSSPNVLCASAVVMAAINPWIVRYDIGFQLSFLATLGLIILSPVIGEYFKKLPETAGLKELMTQTLSAIIITSPLIAWYFGTISIIAPIANLLVVPLTPVIMAVGFGWLLIASGLAVLPVVSASVITFLSIPTYLMLSYCITITEWLASIPFASIPVALPLGGMIAFYVLIAIWMVIEQKRSKANLLPKPSLKANVVL